MKDITYIYAMQHNKTKKMYIGKSKNVYKRYESHIANLKVGKHASELMQEEYDEYGEDYSVYVLEEVENPSERFNFNGNVHSVGSEAEMKWIREYNTIENGYNTQDTPIKRMIKNSAKVFPIKDGLPERMEK